ncbi:phosphoadenylyl-sulfate reductase [bacterium]|nr:phosphoadenylyl-sulfate reductase [bacterium]
MIPALPKSSRRTRIDLTEALTELQTKSPEERMIWAGKNFPDQALATTSFGAQSAAFLHLVSRTAPEMPVVFIDTGYHFPETLAFSRELTAKLRLNLKIYRPMATPEEIESRHGRLWEKGPAGLEKFHEIIRVEPLRRALAELNPKIWLAGLRRSGSEHRQKQAILSRQDSRWKLLPILDWSDREVGAYLQTHALPFHPLWEKGYISIGDRVTTKRLDEVSDPSELRHFGWKRECGLHDRV